MRTPEEIKKGLECCNLPGCKGEECPYDHDDPCHFVMHEDALAYIKQLEANQPKWISVVERLPEDGKIALTYTEYFYEILQWDAKAELWVGRHGFINRGYVTHWMPLPLPPKEDE